MATAITIGKPSGYAGAMAVPAAAGTHPSGVTAQMLSANGSTETSGCGRTRVPSTSAAAALTYP